MAMEAAIAYMRFPSGTFRKTVAAVRSPTHGGHSEAAPHERASVMDESLVAYQRPRFASPRTCQGGSNGHGVVFVAAQAVTRAPEIDRERGDRRWMERGARDITGDPLLRPSPVLYVGEPARR
jgi:hypothetical protein